MTISITVCPEDCGSFAVADRSLVAHLSSCRWPNIEASALIDYCYAVSKFKDRDKVTCLVVSL